MKSLNNNNNKNKIYNSKFNQLNNKGKLNKI